MNVIISKVYRQNYADGPEATRNSKYLEVFAREYSSSTSIHAPCHLTLDLTQALVFLHAPSATLLAKLFRSSAVPNRRQTAIYDCGPM